MIRYKNSSKWEEIELPEAKQMSDEGAGHKAYVTKDRLGSMLLKCYQHCGSEFYSMSRSFVCCALPFLYIQNLLYPVAHSRTLARTHPIRPSLTQTL